MDNRDTQYNDIGYNFLISNSGNVYEGAGWDQMAHHSKCHNPTALAISFIGDFQRNRPSSNALDAAKRLIACGVSKGKISSSYTLHGHRDGRSTTCPGNALYNEIKTWANYGGGLRKC
jgi:N-acetylmuramoyl-L-alanine amidase